MSAQLHEAALGGGTIEQEVGWAPQPVRWCWKIGNLGLQTQESGTVGPAEQKSFGT